MRRSHPPIECIRRPGWTNRAVLISWPSHLPATRGPNGLGHLGFSGVAPEHAADVGLLEREEAVPELAVGGQADAIAAHAERPADRGDEADPAAAVDVVVIDRRRPRILVGGRLERADLAVDPLEDLGGEEDLVALPVPPSSGMYSMNRISRPCSRANRASGTTSSSVIPLMPRR